MNEIKLVKASAEIADKIETYRDEFPSDRERVTYLQERIPGLDYLEDYASVSDWLRFCESMSGKITWYMSIRETDEKIIGAAVLRHSLEYDDDDPDFASHIGYSISPCERRKGYGKEQLRLVLQEAKDCGLDRVRIVCLDTNAGSVRTILSNGGIYVDTLHGEESGLNINRYDISLS